MSWLDDLFGSSGSSGSSGNGLFPSVRSRGLTGLLSDLGIVPPIATQQDYQRSLAGLVGTLGPNLNPIPVTPSPIMRTGAELAQLGPDAQNAAPGQFDAANSALDARAAQPSQVYSGGAVAPEHAAALAKLFSGYTPQQGMAALQQIGTDTADSGIKLQQARDMAQSVLRSAGGANGALPDRNQIAFQEALQSGNWKDYLDATKPIDMRPGNPLYDPVSKQPIYTAPPIEDYGQPVPLQGGGSARFGNRGGIMGVPLNAQPAPKLEFQNGQAVNPYNAQPVGAQIPRQPEVPLPPDVYKQKLDLATALGQARNPALAPQPPITIDPNSNNLSAQTALSETAIAAATGRLSGRSAAVQTMANNELQKWGIAHGMNIDTLRPQAKATYDVLENNIKRNNQAIVLEQELQGSAQTLAPILDAAHRGSVNIANVLAAWGGKQVNDPAAVQVADQLSRYRQELAGYNAVAGGHLSQNGTPEPKPEDYAAAERVITNGINSGNVKAIADSVALSAAKNRKVLQGAIDKANSDFFDLFGAKYHVPNAAPGAQSAPAGASVPTATGPNGQKLYLRNGQWSPQ